MYVAKVEDLAEGLYYMAAVKDGYQVWNGTMSSNSTANSTSVYMVTSSYSYDENAKTINAQSTNDAAKIELIAVAGKANTYYIKSGDKYLYEFGTKSHQIQLGNTSAEWVFSNVDNGVVATSSTLTIGTAIDAISNYLRAYTNSSTPKAMVLFYAGDGGVTAVEGGSTGGGSTDPNEPGGDSKTYTASWNAYCQDGSNNTYTGSCTMNIGGIDWVLEGNSKINPWRLGGKTISNTDRALYSATKIPENISEIAVSHGTISSKATVNSFKVIVSKNDDFSNPVYEQSYSVTANSTTAVSRPDGQDWSDCYFKFVYNVTTTGTGNEYVQLNEVKLTGK